MKKPTDSLHRLVHSMTQAEKRYFKMHFALSRNVLVALYEIVNKMGEYDEESVKEQLPENAAKNLKVHKVQLIDLLLRSLVLYHQKRKLPSKIRSGLEEVDVLMTKHLHELAADRLARLKQMCLKYEEYVCLLEVAYREFRLFHVHEDKIGISQWAIYEEMGACLDHLQQQHRYSLLGVELIDLQKQEYHINITDEKRLYYEQILQRLHDHTREQESFRALLTKNIAYTLTYQALRAGEKEMQYREQNVRLFERHPHFKDSMPFEFIAVMRNYANYCLDHEQFEALSKVVASASAFIRDNPEWEHQLIYFYFSELHMHFKQEDYVFIKEQIEPVITEQIDRLKISENRIAIMVFALLAVTNIVLHQPKLVQFYLRKLHDSPSDLQQYFNHTFHIIAFVNHCETHDEFLVENAIITLKRKCSEEHSCPPFFLKTLDFFKEIISTTHRRAAARNFMAIFGHYQQDTFYQHFIYFGLNRWVEAIAENRKFSQPYLKKK